MALPNPPTLSTLAARSERLARLVYELRDLQRFGRETLAHDGGTSGSSLFNGLIAPQGDPTQAR